MRPDPPRVGGEQRRDQRAGGVAEQNQTLRVAAVAIDVARDPGHRRGGVLDVGRVLDRRRRQVARIAAAGPGGQRDEPEPEPEPEVDRRCAPHDQPPVEKMKG